MTKKNSHYLMRLFLLIFALSTIVPILSCSRVPSYGLFGELKSLVVVNEDKEELSEISSKVTIEKKQKCKNIFNLWLIVLAHIVCLQLLAYSIKLPKADTIVAKRSE